jgi:hypothetical protein
MNRTHDSLKWCAATNNSALIVIGKILPPQSIIQSVTQAVNVRRKVIKFLIHVLTKINAPARRNGSNSSRVTI